jgi:hypothetical protein
MPLDQYSLQIVCQSTFEKPSLLQEGSIEAEFEKHRARFARQPFDLTEENRRRGWAAFKVWHQTERERAAEYLAHIPPNFSD